METINQAIRRAQEAGAPPTSKNSPALSQRGLLPEQPEEQRSSPLSVFRHYPPATVADIMPFVLRLAVNFPAMNTSYQTPNGQQITFWTVLADQVAALGWSVERIRYAVDYMLRNCPYREFRVAEFLQLDKQIHAIDNAEFARIDGSRQPNAPIVSAQIDGKWILLYKADADRIGLTDYKRRYTTYEVQQMTPEQRKQNGIYWM